MTDFFIYNNTPEILIKKLTRAELEIYMEIKKLTKAVNNYFVYATIDYLINHSTYNSKSFISKTLSRLTEKGLIVRELVQSNKSRHKAYKYYLVRDLTLTALYQNLSEEEKNMYIISVNAAKEPYTTLTEEENKLYVYLKYTCKIKDLTHRKLKILLACAKNNTEIIPGTEIDTVILMAKYCIDTRVINKFGYLKKTIINYSTEPKASYTSCNDTVIKSDTFTEPQECLYKACNDMNVRLSTKQIKAIVSVSGKLTIDVNKVIGIISDVRHVKGIKDIFRYIIKSVYNYNDKLTYIAPTQEEQSYDFSKFISISELMEMKKRKNSGVENKPIL